MKLTAISTILILISCASINAQFLSATSLRVGTTNQTADGCIAAGENNRLSASDSVFKAWRTAVIGNNNATSAWDSLLVGSYNNTDHDEWLDGDAESSAVIGKWNWLAGDRSLIVGTGNQITRAYTGQVGSAEWVKSRNSVVMGSGLINRFDNCTIIGKNNVSQAPTAPHSGPAPLLIVGNGSSASNRSNAFVVLDNGDIIISKPQGDISMGIYGD